MCITVIKSTENDDKYTVKKKRGTDGRNTKKNHISRKSTGRRVPGVRAKLCAALLFDRMGAQPL